jgi:hypothetical protein
MLQNNKLVKNGLRKKDQMVNILFHMRTLNSNLLRLKAIQYATVQEDAIIIEVLIGKIFHSHMTIL